MSLTGAQVTALKRVENRLRKFPRVCYLVELLKSEEHHFQDPNSREKFWEYFGLIESVKTLNKSYSLYCLQIPEKKVFDNGESFQWDPNVICRAPLLSAEEVTSILSSLEPLQA